MAAWPLSGFSLLHFMIKNDYNNHETKRALIKLYLNKAKEGELP